MYVASSHAAPFVDEWSLMDNSDVKDDILDIDRGPATPQLSKEAIMGSLKVT